MNAYSHESMIYQTYYQFLQSGFPEDHIIMMSMNGTAYNKQNPLKGQIYEYEGGPNLYPIVKDSIDFAGPKLTTPENFLKILRGEEVLVGKKVLKSGPDDNLFIMTGQHGALGYTVFVYEDDSNEKMLYGEDIITTIDYMQTNKMFKNLFWIQVACFSGSLFNQKLPYDNVLFYTAATQERSSSECDFSDRADTWINVCMGKSFLEFWRDNMNESEMSSVTLQQVFDYSYKNRLWVPNVMEEYCQYGNTYLSNKLTLSDFFGKGKSENNPIEISNGDIPNLGIKKRREKVINMNDDPLTYDVDHGLCNFFPPLNLTCVKQVTESLRTTFGHRTGMKCSISYMDYLQNRCIGTSPDINDIYNKMIVVCKVMP